MEKNAAITGEFIKGEKLGLAWTEEYAKEFHKKYRAEKRRREKAKQKA